MQHLHSHKRFAMPTDVSIVIRGGALATWLASVSGYANSPSFERTATAWPRDTV